jgi:hypothetical protein
MAFWSPDPCKREMHVARSPSSSRDGDNFAAICNAMVRHACMLVHSSSLNIPIVVIWMTGSLCDDVTSF